MSKTELKKIANEAEIRKASLEAAKASVANRPGATFSNGKAQAASMNAAPPVPADFNSLRSGEKIQWPTVAEANELELWIELNMGGNARPTPGVMVWSVTDQRYKPFYFSSIQQTRAAYDPEKKVQLVDASTGRPKVMSMDPSSALYTAWMAKGPSASYGQRYENLAGKESVVQYGSVFTWNRFANSGAGAYTTQSYLASATLE